LGRKSWRGPSLVRYSGLVGTGTDERAGDSRRAVAARAAYAKGCSGEPLFVCSRTMHAVLLDLAEMPKIKGGCI